MERQEPTTRARDVDIEFGRAWRDHRRHLLDIAFRMLGNITEAEDAVQEAFARLVRADVDQIDDVGGWLVVVVGRVCLGKLRSHRRHPTTPEAALGERSGDAPVDPADRITLDDSIRMALHRVLERLTPAERSAFVLHDVFQYPFDAVSEIVGRTPAACRQLASRARRNIASEMRGSSRFQVESAEQRRVTERFIAACTTGDVDALLAILDPDVDGRTEVGGRVGRIVVAGREAVATQILRYLGPSSSTTLLSLPAWDAPGVVALRDGHVVSLLTLTVREGCVDHIDGLADPSKLEPIAAALGL